MTLFANGLLPASYRGAPFAVQDSDTAGGRRVALHQYPGRDEPWAEDMGRDARRFRFRGFITDNDVVFAGGPIQLQRALLLAALEKGGAGVLTHPTLGVLSVVVTRFAMGEDLGAGRFSNLELEFVEAGKRSYPSLLTSGSGLLSATALAIAGLAADGVRAVALARGAGGRRQDAKNTAAEWSNAIVAAGTDATALHRYTARLPGNFGRFAGGGNVGVNGRVDALPPATTLADVIADASDARASISVAAYAVNDAIAKADLGYASEVPAALTTLARALAAASADPEQTIRLVGQLIAYAPLRPEAGTAIGMAITAMIRRSLAAVLAAAAGAYQPTSADDASAMIAQIAVILDQLATAAADAGEDQTYTALRGLRGAMTADLRTRGGTLAQLRTVRSAAPTPALALAQRLYRDADRAGQLVEQAAPPHPLFLPIRFEALGA